MILYVNGDSHAAGAEAVNQHVFAEDDPDLYHLGRQPHPDNLTVSWGHRLSLSLDCPWVCHAESASSNARIIRTTKEWLKTQPDLDAVLVLIQWSTWEREEWLIDGTIYQVNASGLDHVPRSAHDRYREFVANVDWPACTQKAHDQIWLFHTELSELNIKHIFFNGNNHFASVPTQFCWGKNYLAPYETNQTFDQVLRSNGFRTVNDKSWHFGPDAHCFWAEFMLQYVVANKFLEK